MSSHAKSSGSSKVALVTGGSSGIGLACAIEFANEGYNVVICGRDTKKLKEAEKEIRESGKSREGLDVLAVEVDVGEVDDIKSMFKKIEEKFGRLDVIVANAGVNGVWAPIEDTEVEEFDKVININLRGTWLTIKYGLPLLKKREEKKEEGEGKKEKEKGEGEERPGSIVIMSSINGNRTFGNTGATAYSTSKAGLVAMGKMLALELAKYGIRVNVVCPGAIETNIDDPTKKRNLEGIRIKAEFPEGLVPLTKDHGAASAKHVASVVYFLSSSKSGHVTGTEIYVDGAESLISI